MNHIEQTLVDVATAALMRGGHDETPARIIALETVADDLTKRSKNMREYAKYAEGKTYHREMEQANELLTRANAIMQQAAELREKSK
ncbi:hypothetical protein FHP88_15555 [Sedimenticola selenatireducens]|uniref:Uncharacterized protein n=1 Tax=Sedimenticola selenatireducens TaxID=191960 RepID=A0A557S0H5_9GAMM|nr:hypothetical protein [Sedimenticola selenatireducens]TVO70869.1 hypothetical protein FHP88_15555 [Sedimenticola selenatireducens]